MRNVRLELLPHTSRTREAVSCLRQAEFKLKFGASVDAEGLAWNATDESSTNFGAWSGDRLVSTLRMTSVIRPHVFEEILQFSAANAFVQLPCAILARAATGREWAGRGLGMALRVMAYEHWLTESREQNFLYGTAFANSSRLATLRSWGYEFVENEAKWDCYLKSHENQIAVFRIDRARLIDIWPDLRRDFLDPHLNRSGQENREGSLDEVP